MLGASGVLTCDKGHSGLPRDDSFWTKPEFGQRGRAAGPRETSREASPMRKGVNTLHLLLMDCCLVLPDGSFGVALVLTFW
jgi:hypothetical protein